MLQVEHLNVHGGGTIHAVHLNITVVNLTVDDLGTIVGDLHQVPCTQGQGHDGLGASGDLTFFYLMKSTVFLCV